MDVTPANQDTINRLKECIDNLKENWDTANMIIIDSIILKDEVMK